MADPLTILKQRSSDDWLVGDDSREFFALAEQVLAELRSYPRPESLTILLAEREPLTFLAHFIAACAANCRIVLANPNWVQAEWQQVFELVQPDVIWGEELKTEGKRQKVKGKREGTEEVKAEGKRQKAKGIREGTSVINSQQLFSASQPSSLTPHILIPTGGTSGNIRFAAHTWETLMASVEGFREYFEIKLINSFCVLPLYHVSGLMQFMRSFTTGGKLVVLPFKALEAGDRSSISPEAFFLSLVPTQLQRLLDSDEQTVDQESEARSQKPDSSLLPFAFCLLPSSPTPHSPLPTADSSIPWLARFHTVLLGGAPAWSDLLDRARAHRIRLAPTYGMTETASQIATLKPDDFLNGQTNAGYVLPHAQITIRNPSGNILKAHQIGHITIQAKSLAIDYYPMLPGDGNQLGVTTQTNQPSTNALAPCQNSCSGGLGELGPRKTGDEMFSVTLCHKKHFGRGEVPRTQSLYEAEMLAHQDLERGEKGFQPDDLGFFDANGYLHIIGRQSDKIITGGENVFPAEVEAAIRSTGLVKDVCVIGISDRHWGQAITAVYTPINADILPTSIQTALSDTLSKFKRPKHWLAIDRLPRNAQGKVNRPQVEAIAKMALPIVPTTG
jgi:O-succinylbenzoic acid--CoA ligase